MSSTEHLYYWAVITRQHTRTTYVIVHIPYVINRDSRWLASIIKWYSTLPIYSIVLPCSVRLYTVDSLFLEHPLSRTSLYLEQFSLSLGHFHWFQPNFLSLSWTSISRTSLYLEQKIWSHANVSLPISNFSAFTQPVKAGFHSAHFPSGRAGFFLSAWNKEPIRNCYLKN